MSQRFARAALARARRELDAAERALDRGHQGSLLGPGALLPLARRFLGVTELAGRAENNPQIVAMLQRCRPDVVSDEVAWCSAYVNHVAWLAGCERSASLRARSWLRVGRPIADWDEIRAGDVVVLSRGRGPQPGPEVIAAPGHVGFVAEAPAAGDERIAVLGGNQGNRVSIARYPAGRVLGVRRLEAEGA